MIEKNQFPLYHGSNHPFKVGEAVEPRRKEAWATHSKNVAGAYGFRVFEVEHLGDSQIKELNSLLGFRIIAEVSNPHDTGKCGVMECDYSDNHGIKIKNGMEFDR